jgi:hypothetical protein
MQVKRLASINEEALFIYATQLRYCLIILLKFFGNMVWLTMFPDFFFNPTGIFKKLVG